MDPEFLWWEIELENRYAYSQMLYNASAFFPDSEIDNFASIAEQLWAVDQDLA